MGLFGGGGGKPFKPITKRGDKGLDRFDKLADAEVTGPRKSADIVLDTLGDEATRSIASLGGNLATNVNTQFSNLAAQGGGLDPSKAAALANQALTSGSKATANMLGEQTAQSGDILAGDVLGQEQQKFKAAELAGVLGIKQDEIATKAAAAAAAAAAQKQAGKSKLIGGLFSAAGTAFGGPLGGAAGGMIGQAITS